jgi:hypothetical protein
VELLLICGGGKESKYSDALEIIKPWIVAKGE